MNQVAKVLSCLGAFDDMSIIFRAFSAGNAKLFCNKAVLLFRIGNITTNIYMNFN